MCMPSPPSSACVLYVGMRLGRNAIGFSGTEGGSWGPMKTSTSGVCSSSACCSAGAVVVDWVARDVMRTRCACCETAQPTTYKRRAKAQRRSRVTQNYTALYRQTAMALLEKSVEQYEHFVSKCKASSGY